MCKTLRKQNICLYIALISVIVGCKPAKQLIQPQIISESTDFEAKQIRVDMSSMPDSVYMRVQGSDIELDFNGTVIDGRVMHDDPASFRGIGISVANAKNVTIRNLKVHGFRIAILAENVENLKIVNCDLSYNYRPRLHSEWDRESLSDWLYFHNNEQDEWKRYGAAIYLKNCNNALIKDVTCVQGMNALLMVNCQRGLIYNNTFSYNSGLGIGLYRSSHNKIMHNKLDWNARGYSHGKYARGQDSAAILLYEQSSQNTIAYNSATHSGDGLFLWAGQHTMDTGLGGCDSNLIYRNDFSHSIANGVEATFSSNYIIENKLNDCRYGVWGGYSHHSVISGNEIKGCEYGIAIEHGNANVIEDNVIADCTIGIQLWERDAQPSDWPYARVRDVRSRNTAVERNQFTNIEKALEAIGTDSLYFHGNTFSNVKLKLASPRTPSQILAQPHEDAIAYTLPTLPEPLHDAMSVSLATDVHRGREYIIINAWGPYNFGYPLLVLRNRTLDGNMEVLRFDILGPNGSWKVKSHEGISAISSQLGKMNETLTVYRALDSVKTELILEYAGKDFINQFGDTIFSTQPFTFGYRDEEIYAEWDIAFFKYDSLSDPMMHLDAFSILLAEEPIETQQVSELAFQWWGAPSNRMGADHFAIRATADIVTGAGNYVFQVESDDGIRLWLDGKEIIQRWDIHTPTRDEITVPMQAGRHHVEIEYFEATGLAVLDVTIAPSR